MTNREKKLAPRRTKYWCFGCDRNLIAPAQKCSVCGFKDNSKHKRK